MGRYAALLTALVSCSLVGVWFSQFKQSFSRPPAVSSVSEFEILSICLGTDWNKVSSILGKPLKVERHNSSDNLLYYNPTLPPQAEAANMFVAINRQQAVIAISGSPLAVRGKRLTSRASSQEVELLFQSLGAPKPSVGRVEHNVFHLTYDFPDGTVEAFFKSDRNSTDFLLTNRAWAEDGLQKR